MGLFDTTQTTSTSLPSWFTQQQQNIAGQAGTAAAAAPAPGQTAQAGLAKTFNSAQNPFTTAMGGLEDVYQGVSTPFNPDGTPNTQSPLGSLFASQYAKLDQILPQVAAKEGAAGIGSGNFNSLRGQTALNTARAGALTTLAQDQNQAALNAQTQAINALQGVGNVGSQYGTTGINLANQEMLGALPTLAKYSDIINAMGPVLPQSKTQVNSPSTAQAIMQGITTGTAAGQALSKILSGNTGLSWLDNIMKGSGTTNPITSGGGATDWMPGTGNTVTGGSNLGTSEAGGAAADNVTADGTPII